jgi:hypothetical protein
VLDVSVVGGAVVASVVEVVGGAEVVVVVVSGGVEASPAFSDPPQAAMASTIAISAPQNMAERREAPAVNSHDVDTPRVDHVGISR